ncbi:MAG: four helix bundle protein [bacterium]|nr:four helix bundle protein [bacterium]
MHKLTTFYRSLYLLGKQIPKRDHFGIFLKIENLCLEILELIITAAFENQANKKSSLMLARIKIEVLKRIVRTATEIHVLTDKQYLILENGLQEISKMTNGWLAYLNK